jgi:hypothetical protein
MKFNTNPNTIPIGIAEYVVQNKLERTFRVFLYLKNTSNGIVSSKEISFSELCNNTGIKDTRSIQKYIKKLLDINWIGYNKKTGNYFIRSYQRLKQSVGVVTKHGVNIDLKDLKTLKWQLCTGLIYFRLNGLKKAQLRRVRLKVGTSALKRYGAIQIFKQQGLRSYFGLSNSQLSYLFKCSKSEANRIKTACIKANLLVANKKYKRLANFAEPDYMFKYAFTDSNKIRVKGNRKSGFTFSEQLTDELIPLVYCKRMK